MLGQIYGFSSNFLNFSSTLDKCISGPQRWGHERRPKRRVGFPKKATTFQDFGSHALTSLTARLIGLSGFLLLKNGSDCQRKIKVIFSWLEEGKTVSLTCLSVSSHLQRPSWMTSLFCTLCTSSARPCGRIQFDKLSDAS